MSVTDKMASGSIKNNLENAQVSLHTQAASARLFTIGQEIYLQPNEYLT